MATALPLEVKLRHCRSCYGYDTGVRAIALTLAPLLQLQHWRSSRAMATATSAHAIALTLRILSCYSFGTVGALTHAMALALPGARAMATALPLVLWQGLGKGTCLAHTLWLWHWRSCYSYGTWRCALAAVLALDITR